MVEVEIYQRLTTQFMTRPMKFLLAFFEEINATCLSHKCCEAFCKTSVPVVPQEKRAEENNSTCIALVPEMLSKLY